MRYLDKRLLQQKYRQKLNYRKNQKKYAIDAIIVFSFLPILLLTDRFLLDSSLQKDIFYTSAPIEPIDASSDNPVEVQWMDVISDIDSKLKTTSNSFISLAIDFHPSPTKVYIKTSETTLLDQDRLNEMIQITNQFIISHHLPSLLKQGEIYEIIVRGKGNEVLMSETYDNPPST